MSTKHHFRPVQHKCTHPVPSPPPTPSDDDIDDAALLSLLPSSSTTLVPTSPVASKPTCRKRKWSEAADLKLLQLAMLRQLAPYRKEVTWSAIASEVTTLAGDKPAPSAGHTRSRFFTMMHDTARQHGVAYQYMSDRLVLNTDPLPVCNIQHEQSLEPDQPTETAKDCKRTTTQILADAAFNAKLREAAQARIAHRPDLVAQKRAAENLKSSQTQASQPKISQPRSAILDSQPTIDQRLSQVPLIHNPVPVQPSSQPRSQRPSQSQSHHSRSTQPLAQRHPQPTSYTQQRQSQSQFQIQSQSQTAVHLPPSSAAAQLHHDLKSQLTKEARETDERRLKQHIKSLQGQCAQRVYLGAIEHNARHQRQKCYVFAREGLEAAQMVEGEEGKRKMKRAEKGREMKERKKGKKEKKERRWARMDMELRRERREGAGNGGRRREGKKVETITFVAGSEEEVRKIRRVKRFQRL